MSHAAYRCATCGASVKSGYSVGGNMSVEDCRYYCSDACLHSHHTAEEWARIVALGEGEPMGGAVMKKEVDGDTLLQLLEMYYEDGMKEKEIAKSLGLTLRQVHQVLADWENGEYKTR